MKTKIIKLTPKASNEKDLLNNSLRYFLRNFSDYNFEFTEDSLVFHSDESCYSRILEFILSIVSKCDEDPASTWSYFNEIGYYVPFPEPQNTELESFYINICKVIDYNYVSYSSSKRIEVGRVYFDKLGGFHYMIQDQKMIPVKRFADYENFYIEEVKAYWMWKNDNEIEFNNYLPDESYYIEQAYNLYNESELKTFIVPSSQGACYKINFKEMKQINIKTMFKREIKRVSQPGY